MSRSGDRFDLEANAKVVAYDEERFLARLRMNRQRAVGKALPVGLIDDRIDAARHVHESPRQRRAHGDVRSDLDRPVSQHAEARTTVNVPRSYRRRGAVEG